MERIRPTYEKPTYGFSSAYKANDVPEPLRGYYEDFNIAKSKANKWFAEKDIPILLTFKPYEDYDATKRKTNMFLDVKHLLPDSTVITVARWNPNPNQIMLKCHWQAVAMHALKLYDKHVQARVLENPRYEAAMAYAMAY